MGLLSSASRSPLTGSPIPSSPISLPHHYLCSSHPISTKYHPNPILILYTTHD